MNLSNNCAKRKQFVTSNDNKQLSFLSTFTNETKSKTTPQNSKNDKKVNSQYPSIITDLPNNCNNSKELKSSEKKDFNSTEKTELKSSEIQESDRKNYKVHNNLFSNNELLELDNILLNAYRLKKADWIESYDISYYSGLLNKGYKPFTKKQQFKYNEAKAKVNGIIKPKLDKLNLSKKEYEKEYEKQFKELFDPLYYEPYEDGSGIKKYYKAIVTAKNVSLSKSELKHIIQGGQSFSGCQFKDGYRNNDNALNTAIFALDVDSGLQIEEALKDPVIKRYGHIYTTPKSEPDFNRYRILFYFEESKSSVLAPYFFAYFESRVKRDVDKISADRGPKFNGNTNAIFYNDDVDIIPNTFLTKLADIADIKEEEKAIEIAEKKANYKAITLNAEGLSWLQGEYKKLVDKMPCRFNDFGDYLSFIRSSSELFKCYENEENQQKLIDILSNSPLNSELGDLKSITSIMKSYDPKNKPVLGIGCFFAYVKEFWEEKHKGDPNQVKIKALEIIGKNPHVKYISNFKKISKIYNKYFNFTADININERFIWEGIKGIDFKGKILGINSPKNTGKSFALREIQKLNPSITYIGIVHRTSLVKNSNFDLGLLSLNDNDDFQSIKNYLGGSGISLCLDSLLKLKNQDVTKTTVVLDEGLQGIVHLLTSQTEIKNKREAIIIELKRILNECESIIVLDANLNDATMDFLSSLADNKAVIKVKNSYKSEYSRKIIDYEKRENSMIELEKKIKNDVLHGNKNLLITADSKKHCNAINKMIKKKFKKLLKDTALITADTVSDNPNITNLLLNKGKNLKKAGIRILIYSPYVQSGISLEIDKTFDKNEVVKIIAENFENDTQLEKILDTIKGNDYVHYNDFIDKLALTLNEDTINKIKDLLDADYKYFDSIFAFFQKNVSSLDANQMMLRYRNYNTIHLCVNEDIKNHEKLYDLKEIEDKGERNTTYQRDMLMAQFRKLPKKFTKENLSLILDNFNDDPLQQLTINALAKLAQIENIDKTLYKKNIIKALKDDNATVTTYKNDADPLDLSESKKELKELKKELDKEESDNIVNAKDLTTLEYENIQKRKELTFEQQYQKKKYSFAEFSKSKEIMSDPVIGSAFYYSYSLNSPIIQGIRNLNLVRNSEYIKMLDSKKLTYQLKKAIKHHFLMYNDFKLLTPLLALYTFLDIENLINNKVKDDKGNIVDLVIDDAFKDAFKAKLLSNDMQKVLTNKTINIKINEKTRSLIALQLVLEKFGYTTELFKKSKKNRTYRVIKAIHEPDPMFEIPENSFEGIWEKVDKNLKSSIDNDIILLTEKLKKSENNFCEFFEDFLSESPIIKGKNGGITSVSSIIKEKVAMPPDQNEEIEKDITTFEEQKSSSSNLQNFQINKKYLLTNNKQKVILTLTKINPINSKLELIDNEGILYEINLKDMDNFKLIEYQENDTKTSYNKNEVDNFDPKKENTKDRALKPFTKINHIIQDKLKNMKKNIKKAIADLSELILGKWYLITNNENTLIASFRGNSIDGFVFQDKNSKIYKINALSLKECSLTLLENAS